ADLASRGWAAVSLEYRRIGEPGGAWPGTFTDITAALDALPGLADRHGLDLTRVVWMGHSAGGHLALWAATRPANPAPLRRAETPPAPPRRPGPGLGPGGGRPAQAQPPRHAGASRRDLQGAAGPVRGRVARGPHPDRHPDGGPARDQGQRGPAGDEPGLRRSGPEGGGRNAPGTSRGRGPLRRHRPEVEDLAAHRRAAGCPVNAWQHRRGLRRQPRPRPGGTESAVPAPGPGPFRG